MTITLAQLVAAEPTLNHIAAERTTAQTRYAVAKMIAYVRAEIQHYQIEKQKLFVDLGVERDPTEDERAKGQQGRVYEIAEMHRASFVQRVNELGAVEVEVPEQVLTPEMLENIPLSANDILALGALVG